MYKVFQMPVNHLQLSDEEFWGNVSQIDELSEEFEHTANGFAISVSNGEKNIEIPYIRFKKNFSKKSS